MQASARNDAAYDAWISTLTRDQLRRRLKALGVTKAVLKRLATKQDNSRNDVYWHGNLNDDPLPISNFTEYLSNSAKDQNKGAGYIADLDFNWLTPSGISPARAPKLRYFPQYGLHGESRLTALLPGPSLDAPRSLFSGRVYRPGRLMVLGICDQGSNAGKLFAVLLPQGSPANSELQHAFSGAEASFARWALTTQTNAINADQLLAELAGVHGLGQVAGAKLAYVQGAWQAKQYTSASAGGYTLETLLGVLPNSRTEPDFHGWELKGHSNEKVSLMTPVPTGGDIAKMGNTLAFMQRHGKQTSATRWDFTVSKTTSTLVVTDGEVRLINAASGEIAMSWTFAKLLTHWTAKHRRAAYVRYSGNATQGYKFGPYVTLSEGISWRRFLDALKNGVIQVDPGYNIQLVNNVWKAHARAQFRVRDYALAGLYPTVAMHDLRHVKKPSRTLAHRDLQEQDVTLPSWLET